MFIKQNSGNKQKDYVASEVNDYEALAE